MLFAVSLVLDIAGISHGHADPLTFELAGLLCLAVHLIVPAGFWPRRG